MMNNVLLKNTYGLFIDGKWTERDKRLPVFNKYSQEVIAEISVAEESDVNTSTEAAKKALKTPFPPYERFHVLKKLLNYYWNEKRALRMSLFKKLGSL